MRHARHNINYNNDTPVDTAPAAPPVASTHKTTKPEPQAAAWDILRDYERVGKPVYKIVFVFAVAGRR